MGCLDCCRRVCGWLLDDEMMVGMEAGAWDMLMKETRGNGGVKGGCRPDGVFPGYAATGPVDTDLGGSSAHSSHVTWDEALEARHHVQSTVRRE
jgi:hypothetical protein